MEQFFISMLGTAPMTALILWFVWWRVDKLEKTLDTHVQDKTVHVNGTWKELVRKLLLGGTK